MHWRLLGLCFLFALRLDAAPVLNADFEQIGQSDHLIGWEPHHALEGVADRSVKHQGKASGRVSVVKPRLGIGMVSQAVSVIGEPPTTCEPILNLMQHLHGVLF